MQDTVTELQELKEVNAELEAYNAEEIRSMKSALEKKDVMIAELNDALIQYNQRNLALEKELDSYRQKVIDLKQGFQRLQAVQLDKEKKMTEMQSKTIEIIAQNEVLQDQARKVKSYAIQQEMVRLEFDFLNKNLTFVEDMLPTNVVEQDILIVKTVLMFDSIAGKIELAVKHLLPNKGLSNSDDQEVFLEDASRHCFGHNVMLKSYNRVINH